MECHRADHTATCRYVPSLHCSRTQQAFLQANGGAARRGRKNADLPRRQLASRKVKAETLAAGKRKRQEQLDSLDQNTAQEDVPSLQAAAQQATAERAGEALRTLLDKLRGAQATWLGGVVPHLSTRASYSWPMARIIHSGTLIRSLSRQQLSRQKRQFEEDVLPWDVNCSVRKKLRKALAKEAKLKDQLRVLERSDLRTESLAQPNLKPNAVTAVVLTEADADKLHPLGLLTALWLNTVEQYEMLLTAHKLLWYEGQGSSLFLPGESASSFQVASRLLGGYIATEEWYDLCQAEHRLIRPAVALKSCLSSSYEICFHKSLDTAPLDAAAAIARCIEAAVKTGKTCNWRVRANWKDVTCKKAFVLLADELTVPKKLRPLKQKALNEGKKGRACSIVHLLQSVAIWGNRP